MVPVGRSIAQVSAGATPAWAHVWHVGRGAIPLRARVRLESGPARTRACIPLEPGVPAGAGVRAPAPDGIRAGVRIPARDGIRAGVRAPARDGIRTGVRIPARARGGRAGRARARGGRARRARRSLARGAARTPPRTPGPTPQHRPDPLRVVRLGRAHADPPATPP